MASKQIGQYFRKFKLPLITGFLFAGIIAGPYVLKLIPAGSIGKLRFIDEFSLAFIAFAAGSELYLKELKSRFKSIKWVTIGLILFTFTFGSLAVFFLAKYIPFMKDMPFYSQIAVSLLAGAILVARSPSSAIAVIKELRAVGPFTQTALGVTVIMDVGVIVIFALNSSMADALLANQAFNWSFILILLLEIAASFAIGLALAQFLNLILKLPGLYKVKAVLILASGYSIFLFSASLRHFAHENFAHEILLEPLLICMIASFYLANYTEHRLQFMKILHDIGPTIYIAFFTLTGASLSLDILVDIWPIALTLFGVRLISIFLGSFAGGWIAGEKMKHNRVAWMAYITQAGVGLGLAKAVAVEFPEWGNSFATMIVAVIIINQIIGPAFFKWSINIVKEARPKAGRRKGDGIRSAIIFGLDGMSLALGKQLISHGWQVKIATKTKKFGDEAISSGIEICYVSDLSIDELNAINAKSAGTIVTMLDDDDNYIICETAYENFGTDNLVVKLNDRTNIEKFKELDALVVIPNTAMISLLDHFVRAPAGASLLLGMEEDQDVIDLKVRNSNLHGMPLRLLRFPLDVIIVSVHRSGSHHLDIHGHTRLEMGDLVTLTGSIESLEEVIIKFDS